MEPKTPEIYSVVHFRNLINSLEGLKLSYDYDPKKKLKKNPYEQTDFRKELGNIVDTIYCKGKEFPYGFGGHSLFDMFEEVREFCRGLGEQPKLELENIINRYNIRKNLGVTPKVRNITEFSRKYGNWNSDGLYINRKEFVYMDMTESPTSCVVVRQDINGKEISSKEYKNILSSRIYILGGGDFAYIGENFGINGAVINLNNEVETQKYHKIHIMAPSTEFKFVFFAIKENGEEVVCYHDKDSFEEYSTGKVYLTQGVVERVDEYLKERLLETDYASIKKVLDIMEPVKQETKWITSIFDDFSETLNHEQKNQFNKILKKHVIYN